jgi:hypothetical protein
MAAVYRAEPTSALGRTSQVPFHLPEDNAEARCRGCGHQLGGLTTPICPECGRSFDFANPSTWTTEDAESANAARGRFAPNRLMIVVSTVITAWIVVTSSGLLGADILSTIILIPATLATLVLWIVRVLAAIVSTALRLRCPFSHGLSRREALAWIGVPSLLATGFGLAWSGLPKEWRWRYIDAPAFRAEIERLRENPLLSMTWDARMVGTVRIESVRVEPKRVDFEWQALYALTSDSFLIVHTHPDVTAPFGVNLGDGFTLVRVDF